MKINIEFGKKNNPEKRSSFDLDEFLRRYGKSGKGGVVVTETSSLQVTTVFACIRIISEQIATLPFQVFRATENGREKLRKHPIYDLINTEPNSYQTAFDFWRMFLFNLLLYGDAYAEIELEKDNVTPKALWPLPTSLVQKTINKVTGEPAYKVTRATESGTQQDILFPERVLHVSGAGLQRMQSFNPVTLAREAVNLAMNAEDFATEYFANGAHPTGTITMPTQLQDSRVESFKEEVKAAYTGQGNRSRIMLLENGMQFQRLQLPASEGQMIESRKFQVEEICRFFNVPPFKVMNFDKATYSNFEEANTAYVQDTLVPHCISIAQSVNRALLLPSERKKGVYTEINLNGIMRGRLLDRFSAYQIAIATGTLSPNEIRELENKDSIGPDGDKYFISQNLRGINEPFNKPVETKQGGKEDDQDEGAINS